MSKATNRRLRSTFLVVLAAAAALSTGTAAGRPRATPGASSAARAGVPAGGGWLTTELVGWRATLSASVDATSGWGTSDCQMRAMFVTPTFTAENTPIWPSVTVSGQTPSTGGWRVPASPEVVGLGLGWLNEATVGDPTALAALYARFHVDAPTGPLSPKKKPWEITLGYPAPFEDTTHRTCAAQPALEPSPLGQAYPVIWQLSAGDDIFGVGCGYVGVATRPVSGPTPFSQTFVLTDAKLSPTRYDVACAGGKVVDNAPACVPPKVVGLLLGTATKRLKSANCRVGRITRVYSRKIARGRVVTQIPAPRTYLPAGFGVLLTVSRGRK